ncbi:hypothetical protein SDC9_137685 [bioreactor metagenome]|uniref:Uncharacterized protein n=1 Tax=bioreactor metagenome TaxID=1076179 RepID=A0A645DM86_9ZZZZ
MIIADVTLKFGNVAGVAVKFLELIRRQSAHFQRAAHLGQRSGQRIAFGGDFRRQFRQFYDQAGERGVLGLVHGGRRQFRSHRCAAAGIERDRRGIDLGRHIVPAVDQLSPLFVKKERKHG